MASPGYSGTPLAKKLGLDKARVALLLHAPEDYAALVGPAWSGLQFATAPGPDVRFVHLFCKERAALARQLAVLRQQLPPDAAVWVSWPKKSSKVVTDITEDVIRELALPLGYVDIKVCAVTDVWSGLKLVVRKELR